MSRRRRGLAVDVTRAMAGHLLLLLLHPVCGFIDSSSHRYSHIDVMKLRLSRNLPVLTAGTASPIVRADGMSADDPDLQAVTPPLPRVRPQRPTLVRW